MVFWGWGYIRTQNNQKFTLYWACIPAGETGKQDKSVIYVMSVGFPGGSDGKESTCNARDLGQSLSWEDPLELGTATHSSILAWKKSTDQGTWQATVHGVTTSWALLSAHSLPSS